jgi:membrane AbrB-like protein
VPVPLQWLAYAVIGVQVGLRFTRESLTSIARMLPVVLLIIVGMVAATALMGALLAWLTPVDGLTAYLATTPGGLFAVLATAADSGSDVTYVMAVQLLRLLVILAFTPLLARYLRARPGRPRVGS